jgi:glycosyltransferase involved in cell wall biosynthesis
MPTEPISGFVISYNREQLIETCLRSIRLVDELIVIDKSSTDATPAIARRYADRLIRVPWSPTVEETRDFALRQCRHDRVMFLDDDEMLSVEAIGFFHGRRYDPAIDVFDIPLRHYILGAFDPLAYYWPEHHPRFFRRGTLSFRATVHGGVVVHSERREAIAPATGVCINHLSHQDTAQWIEKTNRYTSRPDRVAVDAGDADLIGFAHRRIDYWMERSTASDGADYLAAVALLRAVYDMVDRVKVWEAAKGVDGVMQFAARCAELNAGYDDLSRRLNIPTRQLPWHARLRSRWSGGTKRG